MNNRNTVRLIAGATIMATFALARALSGLLRALAAKKSRRSEGGEP